MKRRKIEKLQPCAMEVYENEEAMLLDSLLSRTLGCGMFCVKKDRKPKKYLFTFWVTEAEQESLEEAWDKVVQLKWSDVDELLEEGE